MRVAAQVGIAGAAVVVVGVAAFVGSLVGAAKAARTILVSHVANSPILASGGSMTFRATAGWTCTPAAGYQHTSCITNSAVGIGTVEAYNVRPPQSASGIFWTGAYTPWNIDFYAASNGNKGGVRLCTVGSKTATMCDSGSTPYPNGQAYILIAVEGRTKGGGGQPSLIDSNADDNGPNHAVQYFDADCGIHDPTKSPVDTCEHPGTIQTSLDSSGTQYKCVDGNCEVGVDY